jgi:hypothetical protein
MTDIDDIRSRMHGNNDGARTVENAVMYRDEMVRLWLAEWI